MTELTQNSESEERDELKISILETMNRLEKEESPEEDLDLELADLVLEYLERKNIGFEIKNIAVLPFTEEDFVNRDTRFEDSFLAVTLDDDDEESGGKTYGVWVRR